MPTQLGRPLQGLDQAEVVVVPAVGHAHPRAAVAGVPDRLGVQHAQGRLKRVVQTHRQGIPGGFICRTAAENKSEEELKSDMHFLYNLWLDMRQKAERRPAPLLELAGTPAQLRSVWL